MMIPTELKVCRFINWHCLVIHSYLQVGTLDSLMSLSDELVKIDTFVERFGTKSDSVA